MRLCFSLCVLLSGGAGGSPAPRPVVSVITSDRDAGQAIGQTAVVVGRVVQVKARTHGGFAYLNFGGRFPDHTFAVLIPDSALTRFGDLTRFEGHEVRASGSVWLQEEKWPAMTITDPAALELLP